MVLIESVNPWGDYGVIVDVKERRYLLSRPGLLSLSFRVPVVVRLDDSKETPEEVAARQISIRLHQIEK